MDIQSLFENILRWPRSPLVARFLIIALYSLLAKAADLFIDRVLGRFTSRTKVRFDDHLMEFLHGPICWTIFWVGTLHALVLEPALPEPWHTVLPAAAKTGMLLVWLIALLKLFGKFADRNLARILTRAKMGRDLFALLHNIARVIVVVVGLLWILAIWKIDLTPLFASAGIAGIAIALAAKDTLANFFGGISIFADQTFKVGDYIILENAERGEVVEIGIRSTRIKTRDDVLITIPNSLLANSKIVNESAPIPRFRIRIPVGVAYGSELARVEEVLLAVALAAPEVVPDPEPRVRVRRFGDSSVDFELLCWVDNPSLRGLATHKILIAIYQAFAEHAISIPFPQRDIHLVKGLIPGGNDHATEE